MPGYFETMGVRLLKGRSLAVWDNRKDTERCVVIDEACARSFWPDQEPIDKRLRPKGAEEWLRVVGVVQNVRNTGLAQPAWPTVYVPFVWDVSFVTSGVVRTSKDPESLVAAIREIVRSADPAVPLVEVQTLSDRVRKSLWAPRILAWIVGVSATAAGLMACAGLFGVISFSVNQRTQEFGIRLALGAQRKDLFRLVLGAGLARIGLGLALGTGLALALARVAQSFLFEIAANDPASFSLALVLLGGVSVAACWLPMRRVSNVDPVRALRSE
jgi:putative ABC transport system permease protein